ncbi:MAG: aminotransferase class I/II-fold pyridoxal phosphate-dependent enzyme, partial [Methanobrevibacter sp.]|nr:aminotransferase class I/II-fold pyridoxal phosphate-dependent enzyme [Methanobrevibacter sp.]
MIPFNKVYKCPTSLKYIKDAIDTGTISGNGKYTKKCSKWMEATFHASKVFMTTSCTDALEMTALLLNISPGDEVIMPAYTFVSTANAFLIHGAIPVFVDIRPDTMNIDENLIEQAISPKTKAIVVVHYAGISCEMEQILDV